MGKVLHTELFNDEEDVELNEEDRLLIDPISLGEGLRQHSDESMSDWIARSLEDVH
jgi:hypothetical protein